MYRILGVDTESSWVQVTGGSHKSETSAQLPAPPFEIIVVLHLSP